MNGLLTEYPSDAGLSLVARNQPATWVVGDRLLSLASLIEGAVELAVVLLVAAAIARRPQTG